VPFALYLWDAWPAWRCSDVRSGSRSA
jgi:hypothetical protein